MRANSQLDGLARYRENAYRNREWPSFEDAVEKARS